MESINVEKIMQEIRDEIKAKGYKESDLSFASIPLNNFSTGNKFNQKILDECLIDLENLKLNYYKTFSKREKRSFINRVVRKIIKPLLYPLVKKQEEINYNTFLILNLLYMYIKEKDPKINNELYKNGNNPCESYVFKLKKEEHIFFYGQSYNADKYIYKGISHKEDSYSWTDGKILWVKTKLVDYPQGSNIQAVFKLKDVFNGKQPIIANVNNKEVYKSEIKHGENISFDFVLPEDKIVDITIEFPDACSPLSLGLSEDTRSLALAIESIAFNLRDNV